MTTPIDTIREAISTLVYTPSHSERMQVATLLFDEIAKLEQRTEPDEKELLKMLKEGKPVLVPHQQRPTDWKAEVRYPNGDTSTLYAETREGIEQRFKEVVRHIGCAVMFRPLYAAPQQPDTAKLVEAGDAIIDQAQGEAVIQAHRIMSLPSHRDAGRSKVIEGFISGARFAVDQFKARLAAKSAAPVPHSCPPHIAHPAKGGGFVCSACDLRMDAAPVTPKRLTDAEIERLRNEYFVKSDDSIAPTNRANGFADGLRYARDQGYIGGLSVEDYDRCIAEELPRVSHVEYDSHEICKHFAGKVRDRLTKALNDQ